MWFVSIGVDDKRISFSFNVMYKMYMINPKRFDLDEYYIAYYTDDDKVIHFYIRNPIDYLRYRIFLRRINKEREIINDNILKESIIATIQHDINQLEDN